MIRAIYFDPIANEQQTGGEELIFKWCDSPNAIIWVDLWNEDPLHEASLLKESFNAHPMSIQEAQRLRHPPKIMKYPDHIFMLIKGLSDDTVDTDFETIQLAFFTGSRFLVTRHKETSTSIDKIWNECISNNLLAEKESAGIFIHIAHNIVERFLPILLDLEIQFEEIEDQMLSDPNDTILQRLVSYKSDLKRLRRVMSYNNQVITQIKSSNWPDLSREDEIHVHQLHEKLDRLYSLSSYYYEQAADLQDSYISLATHQLNQIVKILTIITVIFIPLSFLAGVYGMNFVNMPELQYKYAYFIVLSIMTSIAAGLLIFFKRKKWL